MTDPQDQPTTVRAALYDLPGGARYTKEELISLTLPLVSNEDALKAFDRLKLKDPERFFEEERLLRGRRDIILSIIRKLAGSGYFAFVGDDRYERTAKELPAPKAKAEVVSTPTEDTEQIEQTEQEVPAKPKRIRAPRKRPARPTVDPLPAAGIRREIVLTLMKQSMTRPQLAALHDHLIPEDLAIDTYRQMVTDNTFQSKSYDEALRLGRNRQFHGVISSLVEKGYLRRCSEKDAEGTEFRWLEFTGKQKAVATPEVPRPRRVRVVEPNLPPETAIEADDEEPLPGLAATGD